MTAMVVVMNVNGVEALDPMKNSSKYSGMSDSDKKNRVYGKVAVSVICPSAISCKTEPSAMEIPMAQPRCELLTVEDD